MSLQVQVPQHLKLIGKLDFKIHPFFSYFHRLYSRHEEGQRIKEKSPYPMLLAMSAVFIVCQFLKIVPDMYELFFCQLTMDLSGHHCRMDGKVSSIFCIQLVQSAF